MASWGTKESTGEEGEAQSREEEARTASRLPRAVKRRSKSEEGEKAEATRKSSTCQAREESEEAQGESISACHARICSARNRDRDVRLS